MTFYIKKQGDVNRYVIFGGNAKFEGDRAVDTAEVEVETLQLQLDDVVILQYDDGVINVEFFKGVVYEVEDSGLMMKVKLKSLGTLLNEREVFNQRYTNKTALQILSDVVSEFTIVDRDGLLNDVMLSQYVADGKKIDVVKQLVDLAKGTFRITSAGELIVERFGRDDKSNVIVFDDTADCNIFLSDDALNITDGVVLIGRRKSFETEQQFTGDGVTKDFMLAYKAYTVRVFVNGAEKAYEIDYTYNASLGVIRFVVAPSAGSTILVKYTAERTQALPFDIEDAKHTRRIALNWAETLTDLITSHTKFLRESLSSVRVESGIDFGVRPNIVVRVVSERFGIDAKYIVKSVEYDFSEGKMLVSAGEFERAVYDFEKKTYEKVRELEQQLYTNVDINQYTKSAEVINLNEAWTEGDPLVIGWGEAVDEAIVMVEDRDIFDPDDDRWDFFRWDFFTWA